MLSFSTSFGGVHSAKWGRNCGLIKLIVLVLGGTSGDIIKSLELVSELLLIIDDLVGDGVYRLPLIEPQSI